MSKKSELKNKHGGERRGEKEERGGERRRGAEREEVLSCGKMEEVQS